MRLYARSHAPSSQAAAGCTLLRHHIAAADAAAALEPEPIKPRIKFAFKINLRNLSVLYGR